MKLFSLILSIGIMILACKEPQSSEIKSAAPADDKLEAIVKSGTQSASVAVNSAPAEVDAIKAATTKPASQPATKSPQPAAATKTPDPVTKRTPPADTKPTTTEPSIKKIGKTTLKSASEKTKATEEKTNDSVVNDEPTTTAVVTKPTTTTQPPKPKKRSVKGPPEGERPHAMDETDTTTPAKKKADKVHEPFDALLIQHVSTTGKVNYQRFKNDVATLDTYLKALSEVEVSALNRKEQLAFWINAYNAFTIKKVIQNYPIKSITDLDGGKPWDTKWIKLNDQTLSLNDIENVIIRPTFKEPRIHFAVNCAAISCPPLMNKAWTAANMERSFEKQTRAFINSGENALSSDKLELSKIFEWYGEDFGDLVSFLQKYTTKTLSATAAKSFKDYNWGLNN